MVSNGGVSRSGTRPSFFCPFASFLGLSRFFRDFPDLSGDCLGIFPICPFPLSRPIDSTYEEQSPKGSATPFPDKSGGNPLVWKAPGLASPKLQALTTECSPQGCWFWLYRASFILAPNLLLDVCPTCHRRPLCNCPSIQAQNAILELHMWHFKSRWFATNWLKVCSHLLNIGGANAAWVRVCHGFNSLGRVVNADTTDRTRKRAIQQASCGIVSIAISNLVVFKAQLGEPFPGIRIFF